MTIIALLGILLTGDFPGHDVTGLEEDSPAVVVMIDMHDTLS